MQACDFVGALVAEQQDVLPPTCALSHFEVDEDRLPDCLPTTFLREVHRLGLINEQGEYSLSLSLSLPPSLSHEN